VVRISLQLHDPAFSGSDPDATSRRTFPTHRGVPCGHTGRYILVGDHVGEELLHPVGGAAEHAGPGTAGTNHLEEIPPLDSVGHELKTSLGRASNESVVADRTVHRGIVVPMALNAPTHLQRLGHLLDDLDLFDRSVAFLALERSSVLGHVAHMWEFHVVWELIDSSPWNRLAPVPIIPEFLNLLGIVSPRKDQVASHAGRNRWDAGIHRSLSRKVTVLAVDLEIAGMGVVGKCDGLDRRLQGRRGWRLPLLGLDEGQGDGGRHGADDRDKPRLLHGHFCLKGRPPAVGEQLIQPRNSRRS